MVCDGAAIPANPGVNPSLTITALAEHAMAQVPERQDASPDELPQLPEAARPAPVSVLRG
jgi:cholesterol oxidase